MKLRLTLTIAAATVGLIAAPAADAHIIKCKPGKRCDQINLRHAEGAIRFLKNHHRRDVARYGTPAATAFYNHVWLRNTMRERLRPTLREYAGSCLARIIDLEGSGWDPEVDFGGGRGNVYEAYGLPQALPGHKMSSAGRDWRTNPYTQIRWMRGYAVGRYGSECDALAFKLAHGWY